KVNVAEKKRARSSLPSYEDYIDLEVHQLRSKVGESLVLSLRKAVLHAKVSPLYIAEFSHPLEEALIIAESRRTRGPGDHSDPPHLPRCARRERPRRRAA